jgi:hypothetical protein
MLPAIAVGAVLALAGCAALDMFGDECSRYESRTKRARYNTLYKPVPKPADAKADTRAKSERPLPKGVVAQVTVYKMAFDGDKIKPCSDLSIRKEIVLQRTAQPDLQLREIREFYAQNGALITTNAEDISEQIAVSGVYQAVTPLPIPRSAPPGKYRIVSRLMVETKTAKKPVQLAKVEGVFQVVPPPPPPPEKPP